MRFSFSEPGEHIRAALKGSSSSSMVISSCASCSWKGSIIKSVVVGVFGAGTVVIKGFSSSSTTIVGRAIKAGRQLEERGSLGRVVAVVVAGLDAYRLFSALTLGGYGAEEELLPRGLLLRARRPRRSKGRLELGATCLRESTILMEGVPGVVRRVPLERPSMSMSRERSVEGVNSSIDMAFSAEGVVCWKEEEELGRGVRGVRRVRRMREGTGEEGGREGEELRSRPMVNDFLLSTEKRWLAGY